MSRSTGPKPSLPALFWAFARIGTFTFGSGYAMIPMIRRELVTGRTWLGDDEFAEMLGLAQTAPGAMAVNTSVFAGYRLRGLRGAFVCCLGAVLPSFVIILLIAMAFGSLRRSTLVEAMLRGMRPAIVGLIFAAALDLGRSLLRTWKQLAVALSLFALDVAANPHPAVVVAFAALLGLIFPRIFSADALRARESGGEKGFVSFGMVLALFGAFFTIGALTFGGGYAMIPLIQKIVISQHHWLTGTEFLEILAISQITPGPIAINGATFVGYKIAGIGGSFAATLGVVLPSLIIVLALAGTFYKYRHLPVVENLSAALRVAVVALIAAAVIFVGRGAILLWKDAALAGAVVALLQLTKTNPILVLALAAGAGIVMY